MIFTFPASETTSSGWRQGTFSGSGRPASLTTDNRTSPLKNLPPRWTPAIPEEIGVPQCHFNWIEHGDIPLPLPCRFSDPLIRFCQPLGTWTALVFLVIFSNAGHNSLCAGILDNITGNLPHMNVRPHLFFEMLILTELAFCLIIAKT